MVSKHLDYNSVDIKKAARFSVAPMMDWTDRHCRYFHRKFTKKSLLYTEMVASAALVKGKAFHLLDFSMKNTQWHYSLEDRTRLNFQKLLQ